MITRFELFMEKVVWPKIYVWEKGMDVAETKVMNSLHSSNTVKYLSDGIVLGLIDKIVKTYHDGSHKTLQIVLNDGSSHTYKLSHTNSGYVLPPGWRAEIGLKSLQKEKAKTLRYGYDAMITRPGYLDLIDLYYFKDVSKEADIKKDTVVLEREYNFIKLGNKKYTYRIYNDGEVVECSHYGIERRSTILNKRNIESSKDFDASFERVIKRHEQHESWEKETDTDEDI